MGLLDESKDRPQPNVKGSFDCQICPGMAEEAYFDARAATLKWWCPEGHESIIEEFGF